MKRNIETADHASVLEALVVKAVGLGADVLEVEYRDGYEEASAMRGGVGVGIARIPGSGREAATLRDELEGVVRRKREMDVSGKRYALRGRVYESFGENVFQVEIQPA